MSKLSGKKGFTIIELLITIAVTIIVLGSFFRLYTSSVRNDRSTAIRASANVFGEQLADVMARSIRLIGLNVEYSQFDNNPEQIFISTVGSSDGVDGVNFQYVSPFGGPVTKLSSDTAGTAPQCDGFTMKMSPSFDSAFDRIRLVTRNGVFSVDVTLSFSGETVIASPASNIIDGNANNFDGDCTVSFPEGTLVTGEDSTFIIRHQVSGSDSEFEFSDGGTISYEIDSQKSNYSIPFFVLQFLREYEPVGEALVRNWTEGSFTDEESKYIKGVRFGFVLVSDSELRLRAEQDTSFNVKYCPFEDENCYEHTDRNRVAYMFRRTVHIRNYDYLESRN